LSNFYVFWLEVSENFYKKGIVLSLGGGGHLLLGFFEIYCSFWLNESTFKMKKFWFHNYFECILYSFLESCSSQETVSSSRRTSNFMKIV